MTKKLLNVALIISIFSCGSTKNNSYGSGDANLTRIKQILDSHLEQRAYFNNLQARLIFNIKDSDLPQSQTVTIRIKRGEVIWINGFLNMVRLKITPEKVQFYNKLNRTYYDGDYSLINSFLGIDLSYSNIENALLGDIMMGYRFNQLKQINDKNSYILISKPHNNLESALYRINPENYKLNNQSFLQHKKNRKIEFTYHNFQMINNQLFPKLMSVELKNENNRTAIELNFKSLNLNNTERYPFKIPSGYTQIDFE